MKYADRLLVCLMEFRIGLIWTRVKGARIEWSLRLNGQIDAAQFRWFCWDYFDRLWPFSLEAVCSLNLLLPWPILWNSIAFEAIQRVAHQPATIFRQSCVEIFMDVLMCFVKSFFIFFFQNAGNWIENLFWGKSQNVRSYSFPLERYDYGSILCVWHQYSMLIFCPDLGKWKILLSIPNLVLLKLILNMNECSHWLKLRMLFIVVPTNIDLPERCYLCEHTSLANESSVIRKRMNPEAARMIGSEVNTERGDNSCWGGAILEKKKQIVSMTMCIGITWTNVMCKMWIVLFFFLVSVYCEFYFNFILFFRSIILFLLYKKKGCDINFCIVKN